MTSLVVKLHRPWITQVLVTAIVLALVLAGWALFEYGRFRAGYDSAEVNNEFKQLEQTVDDLEQHIDILREEKAVMERAAQIERKAYADVNTSLKGLQSEILELNEELAFYRGIISPRDASRGLHLQSFKFVRNGEPGGFRYEISLTQVLKHQRLVRGVVRFTIEGVLDGHQKVLSLSQLNDKNIKEMKFKFKYFQNLQGNISLPDSFMAVRVNLQVLPNRREKDMIEKIFDWPFKEQ